MPLQLKTIVVFATLYKRLGILFLAFIFSFIFSIAHAGILEKSVTEKTQFDANDFYQALAAEISNTLGEENQAVDFYYKLSATNTDPAIAKRATELATANGQLVKALDGAKRWVALNPNSLEGNQYLALLNIRNSHFTSAAKQLDIIRSLIEETSDNVIDASDHEFNSSESLTFVGAMLASEAHHKKAYAVYDLFIKNYFSNIKNHQIYHKQQKLIAAQLAMKAENYSDVVTYLKDLTELDEKNYVDAKVMFAKALHKLRKNELAIKQLKIIQNHPEANDSHRLELVRLLVLTKQKDTALPILENLVEKHPNNFELLKSLVALQMDRSRLTQASKNIALLRTNENYTDEANYFAGEFAEKLGQQELALSTYKKVTTGSYLKNAHKKTINLLRIVEGREALQRYFLDKQQNASSIKNQAYWIKLQADELFINYQYKHALDLYNKAIRLSPKNSRYRYKRGLVNERLGHLENAEKDFSYVLSVRKNDFEALNALGYMLSVHTNRLSEAKSYIDKAYKLKPNDPLVLDSLGFVLYKKGDLNKAEKYLRKSYNIVRKPEVASHLIMVLAELKQFQEAKSIYLEMQRIFPNSPSLKSVAHRLR